MLLRCILMTLLLGGLSASGMAQSRPLRGASYGAGRPAQRPTMARARSFATSPAATSASSLSTVRVVLPDQVSVQYEAVQLGDVATIVTNDAGWKRRLTELEIANVPEGTAAMNVRKSRLSILIRLAGVPAERLAMDGPDVIKVEFVPPVELTDADVEQQASETFQDVLGGTSEDLRVRLSGPFLATLPRGIRDRRGLRVEVMPPLRGRLGKISTDVRLWAGRELVASRPAAFEVLKRQKVAIVLSSLRRDEPISSRNVRIENRFVATFQDQPEEEDLFGKTARRDLQPGQVLSLADLKTPQRQAAVIAVRARETIEVEAVSGALRVRLQAATAMQTGRVGDVIQFKNPDSGKTGAGRIVGPGRVQIKL